MWGSLSLVALAFDGAEEEGVEVEAGEGFDAADALDLEVEVVGEVVAGGVDEVGGVGAEGAGLVGDAEVGGLGVGDDGGGGA